MTTIEDQATGDDGEELLGLAGAYALGALDPDDLARFEAALAGSDAMRAEVAGFRAALAEAAPEEAPPAGLRDSVLAAIDAVASPAARVVETPVAALPTPARPSTSPARVVPIAARRPWFRRPAPLLAAAAAAVLLIVGGVFAVGWPGQNGWGAQRQLAAIEEAPDRRSAEAQVAGGGSVTLVWSAQLGRSAVMTEGLAELGPDEAYELWYIDADGAVPAGTFDGGPESWRLLDGTMQPGAAVGITIEPAGGSPQPTSEPIALVET